MPDNRPVLRRTLQALGLAGWVIGVPALALGFGLESPRLVGAGATALFAAVVIAAIDHVYVLVHAFRSPRAAARPVRMGRTD